MASTYTINTGIEKPATGEQSGTWGDTVNTNSDILDRALNGVGTIDLSGSGAAHTLSTTDGALSDGQYRVLVLSGATEACTITISPNDAQKVYFVNNTSGYDCTFSQGSGSNVTISNGQTGVIYANGGGASAAVIAIAEDLSGLLVAANNLSDVASASTARTNLGLAIGTNVQAYDAGLQSISGLSTSADKMIYTTGSDTYAVTDLTSFARTLLDDADAAAVLTTLGVTASVAELNILDGVTATTSELNYVDVTTLGTSEASKAVTADANGNVILSEELQATCYLEKAVSVGSTTIDCDEGNVFYKTISANTTFTFDYTGVNLTTNDAYAFTLILTVSGTRTVTWPASVDWAGGTAPDAPASGETDVLVFVTRDGGTTWYGFRAGDAMA